MLIFISVRLINDTINIQTSSKVTFLIVARITDWSNAFYRMLEYLSFVESQGVGTGVDDGSPDGPSSTTTS